MSCSAEILKKLRLVSQVYIRGQTNQEGYRLGQKYIIRQDTFANYCRDLKAGNARARSSYLAVASLHQAFPQLLDDVPLPEYLKHDGKLHLGPYMWVALKAGLLFANVHKCDSKVIAFLKHLLKKISWTCKRVIQLIIQACFWMHVWKL